MRPSITRAAVIVGVIALSSTPESWAWDVYCENALGEECPDPYARAQTPWRVHPRSEHRALLDVTINVAGLPLEFQDEFTLDVYTLDETVTGEDDALYPSLAPAPVDAERLRKRVMSIPAMANLPDFSYTLWDLASGNEFCPPNPDVGVDALDCHNYETHIGWLNSNHMLPQSRRWYEHLHAIALELAADCKRQTEAAPLALRDRYEPYLLACEKQALMVEGVGQHYLQDSWSMGHMWERWGGTEIASFNGDRALGFAVGSFSGLIHGAKAILDEKPVLSLGAPWDDPMCAPHDNVTYVDQGVSPLEQHPGVGDVFVPALYGEGTIAEGDPYAPQRQALLGCAVDGIRAVYAATARLHGAMIEPQFSMFDSSRSVSDESCWAQRATNRAIAEGCGVHNGEAPDAWRFLPPVGAVLGRPEVFQSALQPLLFAQLNIAPVVAGAPIIWDSLTYNRFIVDASYACATAVAHAADPAHADDTDLASGRLPALAGIRPNAAYAKGNPQTREPPAFYADPFPPWGLREIESGFAPRKEALNLFFADANAAERCRDFSPTDLEDYVAAVASARDAGADADTVAARCGQCAQMIAPHIRHGQLGDHDERREAFCELVAAGETSFIYTEEDPASFTGSEPTDNASLQRVARAVCGCDEGEGFTLIASSANLSIDPSTAPSIDDSGVVAFETYVPQVGDKILLGDGSQQLLAEYGAMAMPVNPFVWQLGTFRNGRVAFEGCSGATVGGGCTPMSFIVATTGGFDVVYTPELSFFEPPSMNGSGEIVYLRNNRQELVVSGLDGENVVYETGVLLPDGTRLMTLRTPVIDSDGRVGFRGSLDLAESCNSFILRSTDGVPTRVAVIDPAGECGGLVSGTFNTPFAMDGGGRIAFVGRVNVFNSYAVFINDALVLNSADSDFTEFPNVGFDGAGNLVFRAKLDDGRQGIFVGPDPVQDKVIAHGDELFGSTVQAPYDIRFHRDGVNASGQIAFTARLADGRVVVARAERGLAQ